MKFKSLTLRIWFIISVIVFIIVFITSLVFTFILRNHNEDKMRYVLQSAHQLVLQSVLDNKLDSNIGKMASREKMGHFLLNKQTSEITSLSEDKQVSKKALVKEINDSIAGKSHKSITETLDNKNYQIEISYVKDYIYLISFQEQHDDEDSLQIFLIGLSIILCALPIAKLIANNIAKPLKQLETYTKQIANKEWDRDLLLTNQDEIGRLANAMTEMKNALKLADEEEKKFLQSISHDLKTPVMVIMSYAQAIIDGMYVDTPENTAVIIKNEAIRLEKKIKQVLYLNTLDYVLDNEKEQDEVYLDKLLSYLVSNFQAVNPDLCWQLDIKKKPAIMLGNPDRIRVSIENILENQLRYAATTIQVSLLDSGPLWVIEIKNDGPHIPEKDINQIFKTLYKGTKGNFGLGLNITQKIVHFYKGSIEVEIQDGQVCFTIRYQKK
ncbi:sensor histidine kinase [Neobacillus vireti]|uniref:sensor histidine kinase n=1 Tax=Neobacillus vireti TaxID=220686 RepID=UPI002FFF6A75